MGQTEEFLTTTEAAKTLGVSRQTMRSWILKGYFPGTVQGLGQTSSYRIPLSELLAFAERRKAEMSERASGVKLDLNLDIL